MDDAPPRNRRAAAQGGARRDGRDPAEPPADACVVITTLSPGAPAISAWAAAARSVVLIGDRKSKAPAAPRAGEPGSSGASPDAGPDNPMSRVRWVPLAEQPKIDGPLAAALSEDHYARKNLGYLLALESGAGLIFDTDDDNLPLPGWTPPVPVCDAELVAGGPFVNVYAAWPRVAAGGGGDDRAARVWPRGFPLDRLGPEAEPTRTPGPGVRVGVWQGLADLDPDVDAIHRLVFGAGVRFSRGEPAALGPGSWCPFNSQATAWTPGTIDLAYLPFTVSMRWTDILRGYVAQRLLWERGLCVGFYGPAVEQRRNEHDLIDDLAAEIEMYTSVRTVVRVLESIELRGLRGTDQLRAAYEALHAAGVVGEAELRGVAAWSAALKARAAGATPAARPAA